MLKALIASKVMTKAAGDNINQNMYTSNNDSWLAI